MHVLRHLFQSILKIAPFLPTQADCYPNITLLTDNAVFAKNSYNLYFADLSADKKTGAEYLNFLQHPQPLRHRSQNMDF